LADPRTTPSARRDLLEAGRALPGNGSARERLPPTGNRVKLEFIDIFRVCDGRLIEHWTSMDISALRHQMRP
jgi:hypothetical protein